MSHSHRPALPLVLAVALFAATPAAAQNQGPDMAPTNDAPNPYRTIEDWGQLPAGRTWGSTSAVYPAKDGNIWVAERCGANSCVGKDDLDTIFLFDTSGKLIRSFGKGVFVWPHGITVDPDGNVWVTDARGEGNKGHQVHKLSPEGKLLMSLGKAGQAGTGTDVFDQPSDVLVAPSGDIFVADGHGARGNNRIVKFSKDGTFVKQWGTTGTGQGEFRDPHALAMDSQGRLYVGDRGNNRIQIFDQDGNFIEEWYQFSRPSGVYIDRNDMIYVADSESGSVAPDRKQWQRGIRIGSVKDGKVQYFIPDDDPAATGTSAAEGVAADSAGDVYGAEVGPRGMNKYVKQ